MRDGPPSYGSITGKILDLDGTTELTGVNVIARNVADPFVDAVSAISGQMTQRRTPGPDGTYTLHGLKPGAKYVVYADAVMVGGFSTPPRYGFCPARRSFSNQTTRSLITIPCGYKTISASPAQISGPISVSIIFRAHRFSINLDTALALLE